jgi:hypothetical protein
MSRFLTFLRTPLKRLQGNYAVGEEAKKIKQWDRIYS